MLNHKLGNILILTHPLDKFLTRFFFLPVLICKVSVNVWGLDITHRYIIVEHDEIILY